MSFRSSVPVLVEVVGLERQRYGPGEVPSPCGPRYVHAGVDVLDNVRPRVVPREAFPQVTATRNDRSTG